MPTGQPAFSATPTTTTPPSAFAKAAMALTTLSTGALPSGVAALKSRYWSSLAVEPGSALTSAVVIRSRRAELSLGLRDRWESGHRRDRPRPKVVGHELTALMGADREASNADADVPTRYRGRTRRPRSVVEPCTIISSTM